VTLATLVPVTSKVQLGTLALSTTVRHPVVLANSALSLHSLSGGRTFLCLGVGSGEEAEYSSHGFGHVSVAERLDVFKESLAIIAGLKANRDGFSFKGKVYSLDRSTLNLAGEFPPIWVGERKSKRLLQLAGKFADAINIHCADPEQAREKLEIARKAAAEAGRDKNSITAVVKHFVIMAPNLDSLAETLKYASMKQSGEDRETFVARMRHENPEAIIGTPDEVKEEFQKYIDAGFREFSPILLPNTVSQIEPRMKTFAKICM
jgi:alkanesulfonate monooxygenase SsuD/methylene tetrahydromethanopterin reductase-like flavin-dependent oxidoreductase (luciferase family)